MITDVENAKLSLAAVGALCSSELDTLKFPDCALTFVVFECTIHLDSPQGDSMQLTRRNNNSSTNFVDNR